MRDDKNKMLEALAIIIAYSGFFILETQKHREASWLLLLNEVIAAYWPGGRPMRILQTMCCERGGDIKIRESGSATK